MQWPLILAAVAAGMMIPAQAAFNAEFASHSGHPIHGAITNFLVGLSALVLASAGFVILGKSPLPDVGEALRSAPWWAWLGGFCGATLVLTGVLAARPLGAATLVACLVVGQLLSSVLLDHTGVLGYAKVSLSPMRLAGVALLIIGLVLIQRSGKQPPPPASQEAPAPEADQGEPRAELYTQSSPAPAVRSTP